MAHGGEEKDKPQFVLGDIGGLFRDFHHQNRILVGIEAVKRRTSLVKLITEYQNQMSCFFFVCASHLVTILSGLHYPFYAGWYPITAGFGKEYRRIRYVDGPPKEMGESTRREAADDLKPTVTLR
jgi:hypothetical protein